MSHSIAIAQAEFVAFDLETTGLHPVGSQIVEIGAVRFRGDGEEVARFHQLVDPGRPIPPEVTQIHGITDAMVQGQPHVGEVLPDFAAFVGDAPAVLLAHNAAFDLGFLAVGFGKIGGGCPTQPVIDTCSLARRRLTAPNYKLETIARQLRLALAGAHRALDDALVLKDVFLHLVGRRPAIADTGQLLAVSPALDFASFAAMLADPPAGYEALWSAMAAQQPVTMTYLGGSRPGAERVVTPLGVFQAGRRVYLSAWCHCGRCEKTFRLDRITAYRREP